MKSLEALIPRAAFIWRVSIIGVLVLLTAAILFDGYIFLFYVQGVEGTVDIGEEGALLGIQKPLLNDAQKILADRSLHIQKMASSTPVRNPFLEGGAKKK